MWHVPTLHAKAQLLRSLFFIPDTYTTQFRMNPILGQGWTLNYEMSFYLLFAIALFFPRKIGIAILLAIPPILILIGTKRWFLHAHPVGSVWRFYTDSIILLFALGVLVGFLELKLTKIPKFDIPISPAWLLAIPVILVFARIGTQTLATWSRIEAPFCLVAVVLCTLVVNRHIGWFNRSMALLGDASYSTYLFHLWVYNYSIPPVLHLYALLHRTPASPVPFVIASIVAANLGGLAIHLVLERPLTRLLRRIHLPGRKSSQPIAA